MAATPAKHPLDKSNSRFAKTDGRSSRRAAQGQHKARLNINPLSPTQIELHVFL
jgi:hypothetical protein